jgi:hypothetical protein
MGNGGNAQICYHQAAAAAGGTSRTDHSELHVQIAVHFTYRSQCTSRTDRSALHVQFTAHFTYSSQCSSCTVHSALHVQFTVHFAELQNCNGNLT